MKCLGLIFSCLLFLASPLFAEEAAREESDYDYLVGSYECIGRWPDSSNTYSGRVEISESGNGVKIIRTINGQKITATAKYETVTPDKIEVLRVRFTQKGKDYEETCMVRGDLDNYARITCYMYTKGTKKVGLETLFPDHGQMIQK